MGVLDWVVIVEGKGAVLWVNLRTSLHSCVKVRKSIELSFRMVRGLAQAHMLDGFMCVKQKGRFWGCVPQLYCDKMAEWFWMPLSYGLLVPMAYLLRKMYLTHA